ncbi:MAG: hypothetical protein U5K74_10035 [Gemmatimonadaceae bacterium]|nr:hypothetical protein [Gemmatimonadaceae bacterium]
MISAPIHVQDVPARHSPQMGFEGANVIFDTWVHPLMMGLEEHLLQMFREDFEFGDGAAPSHLHSVAPAKPEGIASAMVTEPQGSAATPVVSEPAPAPVQTPRPHCAEAPVRRVAEAVVPAVVRRRRRRS